MSEFSHVIFVIKGIETIKNYFTKTKSFIGRNFPERQLYFRARGVVHFISLSTLTQLIMTALVGLSLIWICLASYNLLTKDKRLLRKEVQISDYAEKYKKLETQLIRLEQGLRKKADIIYNRQNYIQQLLIIDQKLEGEIPKKIDGKKQNIKKNISLPKNNNQSLLEDEGWSSQFTSLFKPSKHKEVIINPNEIHNTSFADLNNKYKNIEKNQLELTHHLNEQILMRISHADNIFKKIGVKKDHFMKIISQSPVYKIAQGGPEILLTKEISKNSNVTPNAVFTKLNKNFYQMFQLEHAISTLPILRPLHAKHYISSGFGVRIDPIKKKWSRHLGIDIPSWHKTKIFSTADGKVIKAGKNGSYGNYIEIDHGNGFKTRYGHLSKILVKRGDIVTIDQKIGLMGSTGRSTATHLHYEIRFDGKAINPYKFFKAKKDVFKIYKKRNSS